MLESSPANMRFVQPGQRHWVIRQKARLEEIDLDSNFNLAAALFRLQHAYSVEGMVSVLHKLSEWLPHVGDASLERDLSFFASWQLRLHLGDQIRARQTRSFRRGSSAL